MPAPAEGPSFGVAPSGTCICIPCSFDSSNFFKQLFFSFSFNKFHAKVFDTFMLSFITSPCIPVNFNSKHVFVQKNLVSILITNFNKGNYLKKTINSCLIQNFKNKEILVFDDCSTDNSLNILSEFKEIRVVKNKKKKFKSGPLNQIYGITKLFKISKGDIIFLLDIDDLFKKDKLSQIYKIFDKEKKINFLQDIPLSNLDKKKMVL